MKTAEESYQEHLRATTIADCRDKGWTLILTCTSCRRSSDMGLDGLFPSMTLAALARAARCTSCHNVGAWIDERQGNIPRPPGAP